VVIILFVIFSTASPNLGKYLSAAGYEKKKIKGRCGAGFHDPSADGARFRRGGTPNHPIKKMRPNFYIKTAHFRKSAFCRREIPRGLKRNQGFLAQNAEVRADFN